MSVSKTCDRKQKNVLSRMLASKESFDASCSSRQMLSHITSRWGTLTLVALLEGRHRFSELRQKLTGISERMLIKVLKELEEDGLVIRVSFPVIPPHTEYSLSPAGVEVAGLVTVLTDWIGNYQAERAI
ncbi:HTH-type transcriptional activator HxlR [compost metagenome]